MMKGHSGVKSPSFINLHLHIINLLPRELVNKRKSRDYTVKSHNLWLYRQMFDMLLIKEILSHSLYLHLSQIFM